MAKYKNDLSLTASEVDVGLRSYMLRVYNYMGIGLILTAVVAFLISRSPSAMNIIFNSGLGIVVALAPLVFILVLTFGVNKLSSSTAQVLFWIFAAIMGVSLSYIFIVYTGASVTRVFFISAATFLTMSIYGYTTKADLSRFGSVLLMGLIGIIIASIVNIFLKSSALEFGISVIGVLVFTGLAAFDTQRIKLSYNSSMDPELLKKTAIFGALSLYLDFINLFLMLIRLIGDRR